MFTTWFHMTETIRWWTRLRITLWVTVWPNRRWTSCLGCCWGSVSAGCCCGWMELCTVPWGPGEPVVTVVSGKNIVTTSTGRAYILRDVRTKDCAFKNNRSIETQMWLNINAFHLNHHGDIKSHIFFPKVTIYVMLWAEMFTLMLSLFVLRNLSLREI